MPASMLALVWDTPLTACQRRGSVRWEPRAAPALASAPARAAYRRLTSRTARPFSPATPPAAGPRQLSRCGSL